MTLIVVLCSLSLIFVHRLRIVTCRCSFCRICKAEKAHSRFVTWKSRWNESPGKPRLPFADKYVHRSEHEETPEPPCYTICKYPFKRRVRHASHCATQKIVSSPHGPSIWLNAPLVSSLKSAPQARHDRIHNDNRQVKSFHLFRTLFEL